MRLRAVGARQAMAHGSVLTDARKDAGAIGHRVVGQQPADADAASPNQVSARRRNGTCDGMVGRQDLDISESGGIIDRDVQILPADASRAPLAIPVNAMANPGDAAEPFQVDVE